MGPLQRSPTDIGTSGRARLPHSKSNAARPRSAIDVAGRIYDVLTRRRPPRSARVVIERLGCLPDRARVLDLGAGSGRVAASVERVTGFRTTASDVDIRTSGRWRATGGAVAADGEALPFTRSSFHAVCLVYVLHHVSDPARLLAEVARVLTADGRVVLVEFDAASGLVALFRLVARLTGRRCRFFTPASLGSLLVRAGFHPDVRRLDRATFVAVGQQRAATVSGEIS
ncbi:MAG: class I SAM-dependent methyltransferase [Candidatus Rokubacteria bacterium]|nr:class I SAM-dependent methyltransferase [Candidatus Rokubacteria bacterium]